MTVHLSDHYYDPYKHYCGLYVVSKLKLPEFGPTSELIKIFDERGIILMSITSHQKDGLAYDFVTVDLTLKLDQKDAIEKEIQEVWGQARPLRMRGYRGTGLHLQHQWLPIGP